LKNNDDGWIYQIVFKEIVTKKLEGSKIVTIENELIALYEENVPGRILLIISPDPKIEHWKEYLEYGVWDWVAAMGGIYSLVSVLYLWVADRIAAYSGSLSMGILPAMSGVSKNVEEIRIIKSRLEEIRILESRLDEVEFLVKGPKFSESAL